MSKATGKRRRSASSSSRVPKRDSRGTERPGYPVESSDEEREYGTISLADTDDSSDRDEDDTLDSDGGSFICDDDSVSGGDDRSIYHNPPSPVSPPTKTRGDFSGYSERFRAVGLSVELSDSEDDQECLSDVVNNHCSSIDDGTNDESRFLSDNPDLFEDVGTIVDRSNGYPRTVVYDHTGNSFLTPEGYINSDNMEMFQDGMINCVAGPMGIGKSTYDKARVAECIALEIPVIYVTYTVSLCRSTAFQYGLSNYLETDIQARIKEKTLNGLVICVNSLQRLKQDNWYKTFRVIILDEIAGILATLYDSSLMTPADARAVRDLLLKMINEHRSDGTLPTVKMNDALLGEAELYWLANVVDPDKKRINLFEFRPKQISQQLPRIVVISDFTSWVLKLVHSLTGVEQDRIVLITGQKKLVGNLVTLLTEVDPNIQQLLQVDDDTWDRLNRVSNSNLWIDGDTAPCYLKEITDDPLSLLKYNLFGFSPVVSSGVSWDSPVEWDVGFGITGTHISAETFCQMLRRPRVIRKKVIYVHFTSKPLDLSFPLDTGSLSNMIKTYGGLTEKPRKELAAAMGIYFNKGKRGPNFYQSQQQRLTAFFASVSDEKSRVVTAYILRKRLMFKTQVDKYLQEVMRLNDPAWELTIDNVDRTTKGAPLTKTSVYEIHDATHRVFGNDLVQCANGPVMCKDSQVLEQKLAYYRLTGKHTLDSLSIKPSALQRIPAQITAVLISRISATFDPLGILYELTSCGNAKEANVLETGSLSHHYVVARATVELLKALGPPWSALVKIMPVGSGEPDQPQTTLEWISMPSNEQLLEALYIDTHAIVGQWTRLMDWCIKHRLLLASNSISAYDCKSVTDSSYNSPPPVGIDSTTKVVIAWLGLFGFNLDKTQDYVINSGRSKRRMRTHAGKMIADLKAQKDHEGNDVYDGVPAMPPLKTSYTLQKYCLRVDPKYDGALQLLDMAHRFNVSKVIHGELGQKSGMKLPPLVHYTRSQLLECESMKQLYDSPSYWLLTNPAEHGSKELLRSSTEECFAVIKECFTNRARSNDVYAAVLRFCGINQTLMERATNVEAQTQ